MRIPRIYTPQNLAPNQNIELESGASHHVLKVLRMGEGRDLILFNGDGNQYTGKIVSVSKKSATVCINESVFLPNSSELNTHLAIGISKGDRFDWALQKATELGITHITPLITTRCEFKLSGDRLEKKINSWNQILISACEQSQRNILPQLHRPEYFSHFVMNSTEELKLVLHHRSEKNLSELLRPASVVMLIGPEGGLTDEEIIESEEHGFMSATFGSRVLRTETAPIVALSVMQFLWGDLS